MIASLRAEVLKSRKRWANWILFGILLLAVLLLGYVLVYLVLKNPPRNFESRVPASVLKREVFPENLLPEVLSGMSTLGAAIMVIFGSLSTASEYGWLTVQTILVQKPGRTAVLVGKLVLLAGVTLLVTIVMLGLAALTSYILVNIDGSSSDWPPTTSLLKGFGALWLQLAVWTAFGMFLGVAFRSTAAAIGGGLTYLFVGETLIGQLLRNTEGVKEILRFLPGVNASAINATFPMTFSNPNAVSTQLVTAGRGVITLAVYLAAFTLLALLVFRRRDVSGG
jgi:ABC-type transport system involved in multi-copper enzyme maturation permease subunit